MIRPALSALNVLSNKLISILVISFGLILTGCVSSGTSTSGYTGPSISSVSAKRSSAAKALRSAKREHSKAKKDLMDLERRISRDEKRLKRNRISSKAKARAEKRLKKNKSALRTAKRKVSSTKRAMSRAERAEKRAIRAVATAKRRKATAERRLAAAKIREAAREKKRQQALAQKEAARPEGSKKRRFGSLFASSDPALKNIDDYRARVDGSFAVAAIPVEQMNKRLLRQEVRYRSSHKVGTIVVDPGSKYLYLVQSGGRAMRYGIGVGKAGFEWSGAAHIGWKQKWPKWTPPAEMIQRRPDLEKWSAENGGMPGGPTNPLGARALYLMQGGVDTLYRLHGTPQWASIGTAASSGCIRLMNQDVIDLYERVPNGAKVVVL